LYALNNIQLIHYSDDLLKIVSRDIAKQAKRQLPDLRKIIVFLPNRLTQTLLRNAIVKEAANHGYESILPPQLTTLRHWALNNFEINKPILSQYARELILVDAIKQQPDLFSSANPWGIANELLSLFDAMLLNEVQAVEFNNYYQNENKEISHALLQESDLVKILWEAWLNQISNENYLDPIQAYAYSLKNINIPEGCIFYCVGLDQLSKLECTFLNKVNKQSKLSFFSYASNKHYSSRTDNWIKKYISSDTQFIFHRNERNIEDNHLYSLLLDDVFVQNTSSIKQRAEAFAATHPDPLYEHLHIYKSNSFEEHTKAIDLQIRIWIHENKQEIGVVTTDRKLVRRLRAVLEHANVSVNDAAGWALATTSAAVVVEWWLQLVEDKYPAKQLLALANSPFFPVSDRKIHEQAINFFEKEVILAFNLHGGIHHYRNALEKVRGKNKIEDTSIFEYLENLLDTFETSAQLLAKLHGNKTYPLHGFINELLNSLKPIGLYTTLNKDDAGSQIIDLFEDQIAHFKLVDNNMNWSESRRFMSRIFDQQNYKPPISMTNVTFCSLEQSRLQNFDALIIASVDKQNFPGTSNNYVFFNEQVRAELNIPTWRDDHARHLHQFRCLLDAADPILITVQTEQNGERSTPSPWLEAIETYYRLAYKSDLADARLEYLVKQENTDVKIASEIPFPTPTTQPKPVLIPELKPDSISISQYQSLVNCPYQYFALSCLNLNQTDELKEELEKADFGSLVHQCIYAFFSKLPNVAGPFPSKVTIHNRLQAEEMLQLISQQVFAQSNNAGSEEDFYNELWLQRWNILIPKFIDWEIKRQEHYTPHDHEVSKNRSLNDSFQVHGRLDRVDKFSDGLAVIDYKTGMTATKKTIEAGEEVQLPMYALINDYDIDEVTTQVEFVSIGKDNDVKSVAIIKGDELELLKNEHLKRLDGFFKSLNKKTPLTALASADICERCDAYGVCRKAFWEATK
jgi:ATP-dependent helicase/nuclease subunit B